MIRNVTWHYVSYVSLVILWPKNESRYVWYNSIYQSGKSDYDVKPLKQLNAYFAPSIIIFGGAAAPAAPHFLRPWNFLHVNFRLNYVILEICKDECWMVQWLGGPMGFYLGVRGLILVSNSWWHRKLNAYCNKCKQVCWFTLLLDQNIQWSCRMLLLVSHGEYTNRTYRWTDGGTPWKV